MAKVTELPLSVIEENPQALRTTVRKDSLAYEQLKSGIKDVGLLNPISVREYMKDDGSTGYRLVDGLHRFTACGELGYETIPVNIVTVDDSKLLIAQFIGNNNVKTTKSQFAQGLKQLIQHNGFTTKEVAAMVHRPEKWVKDQLGLLDLPAEVLRLVDEGKLCVANANSLKKLPEGRTADFLQAALTETPDVFGPKIEEVVKELKSAAATGRKANTEFVPAGKVRKPAAVKAALSEIEQTGVASELRSLADTTGVSTVDGAIKLAVQWFLGLDPVSIAAERAKWDAEQAAKKEAAAKREAEKAAKKAAEAAKEVETAVQAGLSA
jgi:ParB family chromosome partitioning protein